MSLKLRDLIERVLLCAFVGSLTYRLLTAIVAGQTAWVSGLVLVGEIMILALVLFRRPAADISTSWREWLLAFAGSAAPLLIAPGGQQLVATDVLGLVFVVSIIAQVAAKASLNFSFGIVPANRGVRTKGLYAFVRHPVYATYLVGHVAFLLGNWSAWNICVYSFALALQIGRIMAEENLLTRDPEYAAYRQRVRYRLVPGVF